MYIRCHGPQARLSTLFLTSTLSLAALPAAAVPLAGFDFDDASGGFSPAPSFVAPGLDVSPWGDADGTLTSLAGATGRAAAATGWHDGNSFAFVLQVLPGWRVALSDFGFRQRASASGPTTWQLRVGGVDAAAGTTSTSLTLRAGPLSLDDLHGSIPVELVGLGAAGASGSWRIDDFTLGGRAVLAAALPEPGSLALLAAACLALAGVQRRPVIRRATQPARDTKPR